MSYIVKHGGIEMMPEAKRVAEQSGRWPRTDLASLVNGLETSESLLEKVQALQAPENLQGWRAYVQCLSIYAGFMRLGVPVKLLASFSPEGCCLNDRGEKRRGPRFIGKFEEKMLGVKIRFVTPEEDPEAWRLAREALATIFDERVTLEPEMVAVGERTTPHQIIWSV